MCLCSFFGSMRDLESLPGQESLPRDDESLPSCLTPLAGEEVREEPNDDEGGSIVDAKFVDSPQEALPDASSCCARDCAHTVAAEHAEALGELHKLAAKLSNDELNEFLFILLMGMPADGQRFQFQFLGHKVCKAGFMTLLGIGASRLQRMLQWLKECMCNLHATCGTRR